MSIVSFRVGKELKRRMDRLRHVNWSEVLRRHLAEAVREEERKVARKKDLNGIRRASREIDLLRAKSGSGWNGAAEVRKWRKLRP